MFLLVTPGRISSKQILTDKSTINNFSKININKSIKRTDLKINKKCNINSKILLRNYYNKTKKNKIKEKKIKHMKLYYSLMIYNYVTCGPYL